jgi:hypothetical protein
MAQGLAQKISYWILVFVTAVVVVLAYYRYEEETRFIHTGSRFTGEDAIWLLENSNIVLTPDAKIEGDTPFRQFINEGSKD